MSIEPWQRNSFAELLTERARRHPERRALTFLHDGESEHTSLSYEQLHRASLQLAGRLSAHAQPAERALLLYPSGPEYVTALFACFYAGIVAVPAFPPQSLQPQHVQRIVSIVRDARPTLLLTTRALLAPLTVLKSSLGFDELALLATDAPTEDAALSRPRAAPDGLALLQYTSGSTSTPKGVMLTHANLLANEAAIHDAFAIRADDVIVSWLPLFHDMGLIGTLLQPLYAGVSSVLMPPQRFMERPLRWLEAISRFGGTVSGAPDFAYRLCAQRVDPTRQPLNLERWRLAFCGAEPVRAQTLLAFADKFASSGFDPEALYPCYGLAEATLLVTGGERGGGVRSRPFATDALQQNQAQRSDAGTALVSCGVARPGHCVLIAEPETGASLPAGRVGEILVSGPSVAQGYFENPGATARAFVQRGQERYLRTGDLGFLHEGELFVTGRQKDMIIVRGQNLYPHDIERAIEEQSEVVRKGRVVAFGLPVAGEEMIAVAAEVSPRLQKFLDGPAVCKRIAELVAQLFGEPAALVLLLPPGAVPMTSSGKLRRSACRDGWLERKLTVTVAYGAAADSAPL